MTTDETDSVEADADMTTSRQSAQSRRRLFWGVLLVTAGIALLLDPFLPSVYITVGRLWPLFFVVLGVAKMTGPERRGTGGPWLVLIGAWLLLNTLSDWRYDQTWPVLIMFLGIRLIWTSFRGRSELGTENADVD